MPFLSLPMPVGNAKLPRLASPLPLAGSCFFFFLHCKLSLPPRLTLGKGVKCKGV